jgi:hypothetical protein
MQPFCFVLLCFLAFFLLEFALSRLPANEVGMIVDKGGDFPQTIDAALKKYGESMWFLREQPGDTTTRALNSYIGDRRKWVPANATFTAPFASRAFPFFFSGSQAFNTLRLEYVSPLVT